MIIDTRGQKSESLERETRESILSVLGVDYSMLSVSGIGVVNTLESVFCVLKEDYGFRCFLTREINKIV